MLQVENRTPFVPAMFLFPDREGVDTVYAVLQATFALGAAGPRVAEVQRPVALTDAYWGDSGKSSVRYAGEAHLGKPATDVVIVGAGHAPGGRPAPYFGVSATVGARTKVLHVFGDRVWRSGALGVAPSPAAPVTSVPLRWERAYGGREELGNGKAASEPRNPVGCGFVAKRPVRDLVGAPVPSVEDPAHPLRSAGDRVPPAGFGFLAPWWQPRAGFAGTYDEAWQRHRAPYLPDDFDPRFFQAAPPDQVHAGWLLGGEPVELVNLSPGGTLRFALPTCTLEAEVHVAGAVERPPLRLETVVLEPDEGRFSLAWRGAVRCDKKVLAVEKVVFQVKALQGVAA